MTSEQIRQKAREYRKQFYASGTTHVNDSAIDQENMLTGFIESLISRGPAHEPCCPKCGSLNIDYRQKGGPVVWVGCAGCGFAWWPNAETKLADLSQFFTSSSSSPKELAGRITLLLMLPGTKIFLHGKWQGWKSAAEVAEIIEQELTR